MKGLTIGLCLIMSGVHLLMYFGILEPVHAPYDHLQSGIIWLVFSRVRMLEK